LKPSTHFRGRRVLQIPVRANERGVTARRCDDGELNANANPTRRPDRTAVCGERVPPVGLPPQNAVGLAQGFYRVAQAQQGKARSQQKAEGLRALDRRFQNGLGSVTTVSFERPVQGRKGTPLVLGCPLSLTVEFLIP